jgi:hypothetical protein
MFYSFHNPPLINQPHSGNLNNPDAGVYTGAEWDEDGDDTQSVTKVLRVEYPVWPWQREFVQDSTTPFLAGIGGIGAGKTYALMRAAVMMCRAEAGTGTIGAICANTYQQLQQAVLPKLWSFFEEIGLLPERDWVYNERPPRGWLFPSRFKEHSRVITIRRWGQILTRSMDNPDSIRGVDLGWVALDEARDCSYEAFLVLVGRLRCPRARRRLFRLTTTPNGYDWIYEFFVGSDLTSASGPSREATSTSTIEESVRAATVSPASAQRRIIRAKTTDNLALPPEYIERLRTTYDDAMYRQEVLGEFVAIARGQVYRAFDRTIHVVADPVPVNGSEWAVCYDFNRSPFSVALAQEDRYGVITVFDEVVLSNADTTEATRVVCDRLESLDARAVIPNGAVRQPIRVAVYGDASGHSRSTKSNETDYALAAAVLRSRFGSSVRYCVPVTNPPVMARINAVNAALRNHAGQVRLKISSRCRALCRDFERVVYRRGTSEIDKTSDRSLTHISDALGYYVAQRYPVATMAHGPVTYAYV